MINGGCQCPQETSVQRFLHVLTMATSRVDMSQQWKASNFFPILNTHETAQPYRFRDAQTGRGSDLPTAGKFYIPFIPIVPS